MDNIVGTSGNDTINGVSDGVTGASGETLQSLDNIDGGAGTDTLTLTNVSGTIGSAAISAATVKNVENLSILSGKADLAANVSNWTGLTSVSIDNRDATADSAVTTKGNVTSVSVKGGTDATVTDTATTDTLASVTLDGLAGAATVTTDALTSLTLNNLNSAVTATVTGAHALNLTLNNVGATGTVATVTDATATSVTVNATGKASAAVSLAATSATALTINADETVGVAALSAAAAKTITIKGDSLVTVGTDVTVTALESVSSVDSTGGVTLSAALGNAVSFTGGAGKDTITLGATTKAITTGAGDDNVTVGSSFGTGGSVDAGEGTDTLTMTAANAIAASSATSFETKIAGFEKLSVGSAGATGDINLANLDDISYVVSAGGTSAISFSNLATNGTLELTAGNSAGTTINIVDKATNTATNDVLNLKLTSAASIAAGSITAEKFEIIKITTDDTTTGTAGFQDTATLVTVDATEISVAGDAGLALTFTGTKLTSFDASGVTKGAVTFTTGALAAAATIKGGAEANTFDITAATKAVSITGGAKVDTILIGASATANNQDNTVVTLAGDDVVTIIGGGKNTIDLGAGDDTLNLGHTGATGATTGLNVVTLGEGKDTINVNIASTNGNTYTTLTGFGTDDKVSFAGLMDVITGTIANKTDLGSAISLGDTAAFADFLQAASAKTTNVNDVQVSWFQFQGNTYVAVDATTTNSWVNGTDTIVKLTGLVDLSTADLATEALLFSA